MGQAPPRHDEHALSWAVRTHDPAFDDWEAFTAWLESDPDNAARYDAVVRAVADAAASIPAAPLPAVPLPVGRPPVEPSGPERIVAARPRRWGRWIGPAVAASIAVAVGIGAWRDRPQPYAIETPAGTVRQVATADGSRITLAGGTLIRLDARDPRSAALERGEALFEVRHDAAHPYRVRVGDRELVDLGTRFDVKRTDTLLRVAVAEGAVMYEPDGLRVRLDPGQALVAGDGSVTRERVDPAAVGGWRQGMLSYDGAPLAEVAADLSRTIGIRVTAAPAVAARPFHGTLRPRDIDRDPAALATLTGVAVERTAQGWRLAQR